MLRAASDLDADATIGSLDGRSFPDEAAWGRSSPRPTYVRAWYSETSTYSGGMMWDADGRRSTTSHKVKAASKGVLWHQLYIPWRNTTMP